MLVAIGRMRWIAALLVVSVLFTLCGCHAGLAVIAASILGEWVASSPLSLVTDCGMVLVLMGLTLAFWSYAMSSGVDGAVAGDICDLDAGVDTDGDGTADDVVSLHGAWQRDGDHVTATLTPTGAASAQLGAVQVELDLQLVAENTLQGTITYSIGGMPYSGPITVNRVP